MADAGRLDPDERGAARCLDRGGRRAAALRRPAARRQRRRPGPGPACAPATASWAARCPGPEPLPLAPFPPDEPVRRPAVTEEVRVSRQVLAEPGPDLAGATLASLADGTPLVTGARRGKGWLILVHTTANTAWSTLPLSGLFVEMLQRVLALAPGVGGAPSARRSSRSQRARRASAAWSSRRAPWPPIPPDAFATAVPGAAPSARPLCAGRSREAGDGSEAARSALNLQRAVTELAAAGPRLPPAARPEPYARAAERDLAPWLLLAALLLALVDLVIALRPARPAARARPAATAAAAVAAPALPARRRPRTRPPTTRDRRPHPRDPARLCRDRQRPTSTSESEAGLQRPDPRARPAHLDRGRRARAGRRRRRRARPVPAALLAGPARPSRPRRRRRSSGSRPICAQGGMILFDTRDAAGLLPGQEGGGPGEARLAELLRRHRPAAAEPVPGRPRADPLVLPAAGLPRPLDRPAGLGRPGGRPASMTASPA